MATRRVVFLMSDSGGGHRAAAEAIRAGLEMTYPGQYTCELIDVYRRYTRFPFTYMPEIYCHWVNKANLLWGLGFKSADGRRRARLLSAFLGRYWGAHRMQRLIAEHPADVMVSVHTMFSRPAAWALAQMKGARPPFMTVVTDLVTVHALAFAPGADRCCVPTQAAYDWGRRLGLRPDQLRLTGLPVHPRFEAARNTRDLIRARLGWADDRPVVLVVGGGEGMGPLERIARALNGRRLPIRLVIIAGRNRRLQQRLMRATWNQPTTIYPFVNTMHELMAAADILVTKAGPATISEACAAGLPMVLSGRVSGQEEGNIEYVVEQGAGCYAPKPHQVADTVAAWLEEGQAGLARRAAAARLLARPSAALLIAEEIHGLAERGPIPLAMSKHRTSGAPRLGYTPEDGWVL